MASNDLYQNSATSSTLSSKVSGVSSQVSSGDNNIILIIILILISLIVIAVGGIIAYKIYRKKFFEKIKLEQWQDSVILEIRVPRESADQIQKEYGSAGSKESKESLSVGEQIYSIMSEYGKASAGSWLKKDFERFSLEMVIIDQQISFWLVCREQIAEVMEKQLISVYPKAHITRLGKTSFFKPESKVYAQEMILSTTQALPFKTYKLIDNDPLNSLTNALSGLEKEESASIQLILTPIKNGDWQTKIQKFALEIQQGQNPEVVLFNKKSSGKGINWGKVVGSIVKGFADALTGKTSEGEDKDKFEKKDKREIDLSGQKQSIQLTPQQVEMVKQLEAKASKPGFLFTLRVIGSAQTEEKAKRIVENIIPAFQIFDIRPFNSFKKTKTKPDESVKDYILRAPNINQKGIINTEEVNSLWHVPGWQVQTSAIKWLLARRPPIPLNTPDKDPQNVYIGRAEARGVRKDIYLKTSDRFRHIYSLGGSGSGKTVTMNNVALQDIKMGNGVCVVDPHGESVDDILRRIPPERIKDVIIFNPALTDRPLALNMLETDPLKPQQKTLVIDTLFAIWDKLYDLKKTGGPMFENYMKNAMRLVMSHPESGSTLLEIPKILTDDDYRSFKLAMCDEQDVVDFWEKEALKAGGEASLENMIPYITSKLAPFVTNDFIKPMIGQQKSAINFREAMDNRKIILVSLSKGMIGENSAYLIGMVVVGGLLMAAMGRSDGMIYNLDGTSRPATPEERVPFFVYIDEMQNFLFDAIPKALEEIRKYKVGFYLAHQFVKQVITDGSERIKDSLMANCATKIIYRCSADDAKYLETEFSPLTPQDIANPEAYTFNTICLVNGQRTTPFNVQAKYDDYMSLEYDKEKMAAGEKQRREIIELVQQTYGRPRAEIEQEIKDRAKIFF